MLKRMSVLVAVVALMWASAPSAQAALIVGDLSIAGDLVPVNGTSTHSVGTATGLDFNIVGDQPTPGIPGNFLITAADGNFSGLQNTQGLIKDFSFTGAGSANYPLPPITNFELAGSGFSFDLMRTQHRLADREPPDSARHRRVSFDWIRCHAWNICLQRQPGRGDVLVLRFRRGNRISHPGTGLDAVARHGPHRPGECGPTPWVEPESDRVV